MDLLEYAFQFIGTRYKWGGDSADEGFDCSGFVQEVLASQGLDFPGDQTAQGLFDKMVFEWPSSQCQPQKGAILFFGRSTSNISHIAIAINSWQMIEAGGEGRESTKQGTVRVRPVANRKDFLCAIARVDSPIKKV